MLWSGTALAELGCGSRRRSVARPAVGPTATWTPICALFDIAHRSEEVSGLRGVTGFLAEVEGQQIPADTLGEADLRGSAVRLLTAHRAKGLEWDLVVVAGVQEGAWPDIRRRGSLLEPDRLGPHGLTEIEPTASRIAEERRLFYVACTRARRRLVVTAVAGTEGEGDQPSRFLTELGARVVPVAGRPRRPLTLAALVAELRRTCADAESPPALREEAASRLARLADAVGRARPAAGADGRPGPLVGDAGAVGLAAVVVRAGGRRSRCRAASSPGCWAVRGSGSCPARARPTRPGTRPPPSAR